jgi:hypothetical protein
VVEVKGRWVNVDGRVGVVMVEGAGMAYVPGKGYDAHMGVNTDVLYGSYAQGSRGFKVGEEVARRVGVIFVEMTAEETERLAKGVRIEEESGKRVVRVELPEGGEASVELR